MADTECDKHVKKRKESSLACSSFLISSKKICSNVDEQFELSWPAANERDSTQIQKEDPTPEYNTYTDGTTKHCPEIKKIHQKIPCPEERILFHDLNNEKTTNKKGIISQLSTNDLDISDGSHQINYWDGLSDEIILAIFSFLTRNNVVVCTQVCKRWHRLAYDETLWYSVDLTGLSFSGIVLTNLLMRGVVVLRLTWAEVLGTPLADESLIRLVKETLKETSQDINYNLQYMDASSCNIKEDNLLQLITVYCLFGGGDFCRGSLFLLESFGTFRSCTRLRLTTWKSKNLKKLSLEACSLSTSLLRSIGGCHQLSVLNLCMCRNITKSGLSELAMGCPRVTELNLSWANLTPESINEVAKGFPLLVKLDLSGCRGTLRDGAVVVLLESCRNLTSLDLSDCIVITEICVKKIVKHGKIEKLSLSRCYAITPKSLEPLASLKSLQALQIFGLLTISGITALKKMLPGVNINGNMFTTIARRRTDTEYKKRIL